MVVSPIGMIPAIHEFIESVTYVLYFCWFQLYVFSEVWSASVSHMGSEQRFCKLGLPFGMSVMGV